MFEEDCPMCGYPMGPSDMGVCPNCGFDLAEMEEEKNVRFAVGAFLKISVAIFPMNVPIAGVRWKKSVIRRTNMCRNRWIHRHRQILPRRLSGIAQTVARRLAICMTAIVRTVILICWRIGAANIKNARTAASSW